MTRSSIIEALKKLDVENDEHWTVDGAPRLDVLAAQFPGLTRSMVTQVAPLFSRKKPNLPDLDAIRDASEKAQLDAQDAARVADEKEAVAKKAAREAAILDTPIHDRHRLTRENQAWVKAQLENDNKRAARQGALDTILKQAGGIDQIGAHPVERHIAARVVAERKNIVVRKKAVQ